MSILDYLAYSETVDNINILPPRVYALDSYIESLEGEEIYTQRCVKYVHVTSLGKNKYQFHFTDILYINNDRLKKQEDLLRRIGYRYNGIIISITKDYEILSIHNMTDIRFQWERIKNVLESDYSGGEVSWFLEQITSHMNSPESIMKELCLYDWLGLIYKGLWCIGNKCSDGVYRYPLRTLNGTIKVEEIICDRYILENNLIQEMDGKLFGVINSNIKPIIYHVILKNDLENFCVNEACVDIKLKLMHVEKNEHYVLSLI